MEYKMPTESTSGHLSLASLRAPRLAFRGTLPRNAHRNARDIGVGQGGALASKTEGLVDSSGVEPGPALQQARRLAQDL